jgi:DNA-binding PadR family transcriptional regulator
MHSVYSPVMSTSQALLALLEAEPSHGYTLKHRYDQHFTRVKPLAFAQVYAALSRFEQQGLARVVDVESGSGPERKRYQITADGVTRIDAWVSHPEPPTSYAASALFAKVSVALMSGRSAELVLDQQRDVHMMRMRELTQQRRAASPTDLLAITFELNHLDADLRWIDEAGRRLDELRRGIVGEAQ